MARYWFTIPFGVDSLMPLGIEGKLKQRMSLPEVAV